MSRRDDAAGLAGLCFLACIAIALIAIVRRLLA